MGDRGGIWRIVGFSAASIPRTCHWIWRLGLPRKLKSAPFSYWVLRRNPSTTLLTSWIQLNTLYLFFANGKSPSAYMTIGAEDWLQLLAFKFDAENQLFGVLGFFTHQVCMLWIQNFGKNSHKLVADGQIWGRLHLICILSVWSSKADSLCMVHICSMLVGTSYRV